MKKILIFCSLILFIGCTKIDTNTSKTYYGTKRDDVIYLNKDYFSHERNKIIVFNMEFNQHEYLYFVRGSGKYSTSACVHNPDCKYCKDR